MKVLLVGNYPFDGSTSMHIWSQALLRELRQLHVDVKVISPRPRFGKLKPSVHGVGKWLGYIDRFAIFPHALRAAAAEADIVHLCDHGAAMYAPMIKRKIKRKPVVVTCHDMIAVRTARGELPELRPSVFGQILQRWICHGLRHATRVACVSRATFDDARRILKEDENLCVILNGLNYPFQPLATDEVDRRLAGLTSIRAPFILHLGSNAAYKNREGVLRVFARVAAGTDLQLVMAGEALNRKLAGMARELRIEDRIVQFVKPDVALIEALYNRAVCLLFPSRYEGFGWPPIEAQACGCPVVASDIPPLAEVLGQSAVLKPVEDEAGMADAIRRLACDPEFREQLRQSGFVNVRTRFQTARMMGEYLSLYRELTGKDRELASPSHM
ncbi:MAG: glycosyltransferase family 1 protein [Terracidiphilus sp.]|jgi:glycosyltransferase involved in cell wall biosynthesis